MLCARWLASSVAVFVLVVCLATRPVHARSSQGPEQTGIYCGDENCYDVLRVRPDATDKEVCMCMYLVCWGACELKLLSGRL